jgi:acyl-CoA thioester hydrolase
MNKALYYFQSTIHSPTNWSTPLTSLNLSFPFVYHQTIVFRDIDLLGHVNNAVYFTYMENARLSYFTKVIGRQAIEDFPMVIAEATCQYKSPAYLGESIAIGVGLSRFGNTSFDLLYHLSVADEKQASGRRLIALGKSVSVHLNAETGRKQVIPDDIKEKVHAFQAGWKPPQLG